MARVYHGLAALSIAAEGSRAVAHAGRRSFTRQCAARRSGGAEPVRYEENRMSPIRGRNRLNHQFTHLAAQSNAREIRLDIV